MATRGEKWFVRCPAFAARFYDRLTYGKGGRRRIADMADDLAPLLAGGRILEIGFGPGRLLGEINRRQPGIELFGIEVSSAMVDLAAKNLAGLPIQLRLGSSEKMDFPDAFFDMVICSGSFYLWDEPQASLQEIHRILKDGGKAIFYETRREINRGELKASTRFVTKDEPWIKRRIAPFAFRKALKMTYGESEFLEIFSHSPFAGNCRMEGISLGDMPIWWRITLVKQNSASGPAGK